MLEGVLVKWITGGLRPGALELSHQQCRMPGPSAGAHHERDRPEEAHQGGKRSPTPPSPFADPFGFSAWCFNQTIQNSLELSAVAIHVTSDLLRPPHTFRADDAPVGILWLDDSLRVLFSNAAARELIGAEIATGTPLDQVLPCEPTLLEELAESADQGGALSANIELPARGAAPDFPIPINLRIGRFAGRAGERSGRVAALTPLPLAHLQMIADIRTEVLRICSLEQEPIALLDAVLDRLKAIIPFDIATYYEHAEAGDPDTEADDPHASSQIRRIRFAFHRERAGFEWPMRWLAMPKVVDAGSRQPQPQIDDLEAFISQLDPASADHLMRHVSTQAAMRERLRAFLYFPMKRAGSMVSALSFAARTPHQFSQVHWDAFHAIDLRQVLEFVRLAYERRTERFSKRIANLFQSSAAPGEIAGQLVRDIAEEFRWDYVGVFRVARARHRFQVVAQEDRTEGLRLSDDYEQCPRHSDEALEGVVTGVVDRQIRIMRGPDALKPLFDEINAKPPAQPALALTREPPDAAL